MKSIILILVIGVSVGVIAFPNYQANEDGSILVDDYEDTGDDVPIGYQKRFWQRHPSDYNPLRRPVPVPRGSKREDGVVYHPIPRIVTMKQQRSILARNDEYPENFDIYEGAQRQKKQTRPTTLIFRLGSWGLRGKNKTQQPQNSA